jgi:hypothetical protein
MSVNGELNKDERSKLKGKNHRDREPETTVFLIRDRAPGQPAYDNSRL